MIDQLPVRSTSLIRGGGFNSHSPDIGWGEALGRAPESLWPTTSLIDPLQALGPLSLGLRPFQSRIQTVDQLPVRSTFVIPGGMDARPLGCSRIAPGCPGTGVVSGQLSR